MTIVVRELVKCSPKKIWPHQHFSTITSDSYTELVAFVKELGLSADKCVNMTSHPHYKIPKDLFDKAVARGAVVLSKMGYEGFLNSHSS